MEMTTMASSFDPKPYLTKLGTNKDGTPRWYLPTAQRVLWFRTDNPLGTIRTELIQMDGMPVFRAEILNADGILLATGYGSALPKAGAVWAGREIEKAETAAIGRALGHAGYGTQFDGEDGDDTGHLADSPVERKPAPKVTPKPSAKPKADDEPAPSKSVTLDAAVWVKLGKDGKPFYVLYEPQAEHDVFSFTREPFRAAGWDVDAWEYDAPLDKGLGTQINLDKYPLVQMEQAKDGYWHVKHVSAYEFAKPYVEAETA
jgi:hypothetical protein